MLNGICKLRIFFFLFLEECKKSCLENFGCYVIEYFLFCVEYKYEDVKDICYFVRGMNFIIYKGMIFRC